MMGCLPAPKGASLPAPLFQALPAAHRATTDSLSAGLHNIQEQLPKQHEELSLDGKPQGSILTFTLQVPEACRGACC